MRRVRFVAVLVLMMVLVASCARKKREPQHSESAGETASVIPTPDTTPVEALRTPAGLVLKSGPEPTVTPAPEGGPTR